tara:strand:- start:938 stop:1486 length:549 start_codon:yes stop_codon:yes gene_type:complete
MNRKVLILILLFLIAICLGKSYSIIEGNQGSSESENSCGSLSENSLDRRQIEFITAKTTLDGIFPTDNSFTQNDPISVSTFMESIKKLIDSNDTKFDNALNEYLNKTNCLVEAMKTQIMNDLNSSPARTFTEHLKDYTNYLALFPISIHFAKMLNEKTNIGYYRLFDLENSGICGPSWVHET